MPTILSHPAIPLAVGLGLGSKVVSRPLLFTGIALSILPDFDVIAFRLGIPYSAEYGHRGFSHSLFLAAVIALLGALILRRVKVPLKMSAWFLFLSMASHGVLDTFTTGGKGIALLWPFSEQRFFSPFQVIRVSPLSLSRFLSSRGIAVFLSELQWVWLPSILLAFVLISIRLLRRPNPPLNSDPACIAFRSLSTSRFLGSAQRLGAGGSG